MAQQRAAADLVQPCGFASHLSQTAEPRRYAKKGAIGVAILQMLLIDLVIIGIAMEVILKILHAKVSGVGFFLLALGALAVTVVADQVIFETQGQSSLWTGAIVAAILTTPYVYITRAKNRADKEKVE